MGKRLFLSAMVLYLFAVIGLFAPLHQHSDSEDTQQHSSCQLCLVQSQVFLTQDVPDLRLAVSMESALLLPISAPILVRRYSANFSRGPPAV